MKIGQHNITFFLSLSLLALLVSGTRACQEDYDLGSRASLTPDAAVSPSPTESETPEETPTPDEDETPTPDEAEDEDDEEEETPTPSPTPSPSPSPSPTPSATPATVGAAAGGDSLLSSLSALSEVGGSNAAIGNWGDQWKKKDTSPAHELVPGAVSDPDQDGYADWLELQHRTDPSQAESYPKNITTTSLKNRLLGLDDDGDGIPNELELELGSNPLRGDTDDDGVRDGAERLSGTDPLNSQSKPHDQDGDGLSTAFENAEGTNPSSKDTDDDGLRDDLEIALGSNAFDADTDKDGILDGEEVNIGSDPVKPEKK